MDEAVEKALKEILKFYQQVLAFVEREASP